MAKITFGLGFVRSLEQEARWRRAAAELPDDWAILIVGNSATRIFNVVLRGRGVDGFETFDQDDADEVLRYLESIRPPTHQLRGSRGLLRFFQR